MKFILGIVLLSISTFLHANLKDCPQFKKSYTRCTKLDGKLPQFFSKVEIEKSESGFKFTTQTFQGPLVTHYRPDRLVRLGTDYHLTPDGQMLENLKTHESSYCEKGVLHGHEATFLPGQKVVTENFKLYVNEQGKIVFDLSVDGESFLKAECEE